LAGREKSSKTRDRGSGETAKAVITVNSTEAARSSAFFFLSRKGLVFQIGTAAVIFFFAAPICRCRDAGKRKFDGETKTSVDRRSQNRALTDRRSDENENLSDFLVEKVSIKVTWKENRCQSQRAGKETGLTPEPGFMSPRFRPIFGFHGRDIWKRSRRYFAKVTNRLAIARRHAAADARATNVRVPNLARTQKHLAGDARGRSPRDPRAEPPRKRRSATREAPGKKRAPAFIPTRRAPDARDGDDDDHAPGDDAR
jgi:hypothetical protein